MLTTPRDDIQIQGNLDGQKIGMKFDENSLAHIMSVLTDLYSDPTMAVIREYSTNALDSHQAAGQTRPIEVSLPSALSPYFKVKDFGLGLSVDDITEIYSKYGASTKRETNDQVGMLGLGCKSALTYTNSFNVVAVKDGIKIHVCISRIEDGTGVMEVVDTVATNEPNGVEIVIPTKETNRFIERATNFFKYWTPGTVLVNGKAPEFALTNEVAPGLYMVEGSGSDRVVMGNVAYPTTENIYTQGGYYKNFSVVAVVPIGDINFTPSREALQYTAKTKATLARLSKDFSAALEASVRKDINDAPTHAEALTRYMKWNKMLGYGMPKNVIYRGSVVKSTWNGCKMFFHIHRSRGAVFSTTNFNLSDIQGNAFVIGHQGASTLSARNKAKVRKYLDDNNVTAKVLIFCDAHPDTTWLSDVTTIKWDDISAVKLESGPRNARKKVENFNVWTTSSNNYQYFMDAPVSSTDEIIYCGPREGFSNSLYQALTIAFPSAKIVSIAANRWDKFKRDYPQAQHVRPIVKALTAAAYANLTDADKILHNMDYYERNAYKNLDATQIDDPAVKRIVEVVKGAVKSDTKAAWDKAVNLSREAHVAAPEIQKVSTENPLNKYPLVDYSNVQAHPDHVYLYMNAAFAATNKENN